VRVRGRTRKLTFGNAGWAANLTAAIVAEASLSAFLWTLNLMGVHHGIQRQRWSPRAMDKGIEVDDPLEIAEQTEI